MGSRIHRAIGWGLPWREFVSAQRLTHDIPGIEETLQARFDDANRALFEIPAEVVRAHNRRIPPEPMIQAGSLLSTGGRTPVGSTPSDLCAVVTDGDHAVAIVFFPTLAHRARWLRRDDDVDYAFGRWHEPDGEASPLIGWSPRGHGIWTDAWMLPDGTPLAPGTNLGEPGAVPAVPAEIRWYLATLAILDQAAITKLRPVAAQWWS